MNPGLGTGRDRSRDGCDHGSRVHHNHVVQPLLAYVLRRQVGDVNGVDGVVHIVVSVTAVLPGVRHEEVERSTAGCGGGGTVSRAAPHLTQDVEGRTVSQGLHYLLVDVGVVLGDRYAAERFKRRGAADEKIALGSGDVSDGTLGFGHGSALGGSLTLGDGRFRNILAELSRLDKVNESCGLFPVIAGVRRTFRVVGLYVLDLRLVRAGRVVGASSYCVEDFSAQSVPVGRFP